MVPVGRLHLGVPGRAADEGAAGPGLHRPSSSSCCSPTWSSPTGSLPTSPHPGAPTSWWCATARSSAPTPGSCGSSPRRFSPSWPGIGANREWNNWDLLRYHVSFGVSDPEYHKDVGFYVFELPFIKFLLGWAFEALIVVLIVTIVAHYLNGGIQLQGPERRVTPAVKTHLSVLLGVLALIKAVDYYFERLELVLSRDHVVNGATATSVHANKPALTLLIAIAVIAAGLFLYNIRQKGWMLPAVAVALWVLVVHPGRRRLPGPLSGLAGQPVRADPGDAVHPAQHQRHPGRLRAQRRSRSTTHYNYTPDGHHVADPGQHRHRPRPTSRPWPTCGCSIRPCSSGTPSTSTRPCARTTVQRSGPRSLPVPDPARPTGETPSATIASIRELNTVGALRVRQPAPRVHPRLRRRAGPDQRERGQRGRHARLHAPEPAAHRHPAL